jgi:hypothetical protein
MTSDVRRRGRRLGRAARPVARAVGLALVSLALAWTGGPVSPVSAATATVLLAMHDATHSVVVQVPAGSTVHGKVTVTGGSGTPTGNVLITYYANGSCSGTGTNSSQVALSSGAVDVTGFSRKLNDPGNYTFKATYLGNGTYLPNSSACMAVSVVKATPVVTVVIHNGSHSNVTSITTGTTVHPRSSVAGDAGTPTGTATARLYSGSGCSGSVLATSSATSLSSGVVDFTGFTQTPSAGSYSFKATYNGDSRYGTASACRNLTVGKATPTVTLTIHNSAHQSVTSVSAGTTVHPSVSVSGSQGTPTGSVRVHFFSGGSCGSQSSVSDWLSLGLGTRDFTSFTQTPATATTYSYLADYGGDATYETRETGCKQLTVTVAKVSPTISVKFHNTAHTAITASTIGNTVHSWLSVTGTAGTPTGGVTITYYGDATCTSVRSTANVQLSSSTRDGDMTETLSSTASRSLKVEYAGDGAYLAKTSGCAALQVGKAGPILTIGAHNAAHASVTTVQTGTTIHPSAAVFGGYGTPTGTIAIQLFADAICNVAAHPMVDLTYVGPVDLTSYDDAPVPGEYSYALFYGGDATYRSDQICVAVTVTRQTPTVSVAIHDTAHAVVSNDWVREGDSIHASVTVQGSVGAPTGSVLISSFANATCTGTPTATFGPFALSAGSVDATSAIVWAPSDSEMVSFMAQYSGDSDYAGLANGCSFSYVDHTCAICGTLPSAPPTAPPPSAGSSLDPGATPGPDASTAPEITFPPGFSLPPGFTFEPGSTLPPGYSFPPGFSFEPGGTGGGTGDASTDPGVGASAIPGAVALGGNAGDPATAASGGPTSPDPGGGAGVDPGFIYLLVPFGLLLLVGIAFALRRRRRPAA